MKIYTAGLWKRVWAGVGVLALSASLVPAVGVSSANSAVGTCSDVKFLGARGSGEVDRLKDRYFGPEVNTVYTALQADLTKHGVSVSYDWVGYPAAAVDVLYPSTAQGALMLSGSLSAWNAWRADHLAPFLASIDRGVDLATDQVLAIADACPTTKIVLSGYSQGAMVMHQVLLRLEQQGRTDVLRHIGGVALIADGDKVRLTAAQHFGSADYPTAQGVRTTFTLGARDIPSDVASYAYDVCNANDPVCDFHFASFATKKAQNKSAAVHASYEGSGLLKRIGRLIALDLRSEIMTITTSSLPDATAGSPYSTTIRKSGGGTSPYRWSLGGGTPSWLTINKKSGVLSGTAGPVNNYHVTVTLTDARNARTTRAFTLLVKPAAINPPPPTGTEFTVKPGGGPVGVILDVQSVDPCPSTAKALALVYHFITPNFGPDSQTFSPGLDTGGNWSYTGLPTNGNIIGHPLNSGYVDPAEDVSFSATCLDSTGAVVKTYKDVAVPLGDGIGIHVALTAETLTSYTFTISSLAPCPATSSQVRAYAVLSPASGVTSPTVVDQPGQGNWTVSIVVAKDSAATGATFMAACVTATRTDFNYTGQALFLSSF